MDASAGEHPLRLATGITTVVTDDGSAEGAPPVLMIHSWLASRRSFVAVLAALAGRVRVVAADLRGHGGADKPPTGHDLASLAADVVATLDAVAIDQAVLVGASSGGYLAQQVAVTSPDRVAGLVLAGSPLALHGRPPFADRLEAMTDPLDPDWVRNFLEGFGGLDRLPSWYVELMVADALRVPATIWTATLDGLTASPPPTTVGTIAAPTLVISGGRDDLLGPDQARALVAAVPGARWIEYAEAGHLVMEEQPERLAADVLAFLEELPASDGG